MIVLTWLWDAFIWLLKTPLFSGVIVAVVLWWRTRAGKLTLHLRKPEQGTVKPVPDARIYRHLVVSNTRRACPAHNVRVYLKEVVVMEQGTKRVLHTNDIPMKHQWEDNDHEKRKPPRERTVGAPIVWDLCSVGKDTNAVRVEVADASWNWDPTALEPKRLYLLTFEATSNEVFSDPLRVSICWDGEWNDDTTVFAEKHLKIEELGA